MKEQTVPCVFCRTAIPMSKAWPILQRTTSTFSEVVMTCKGHPGVDETIRQQLLAGDLRAENNPDNPDFQIVAQLAKADKKE